MYMQYFCPISLCQIVNYYMYVYVTECIWQHACSKIDTWLGINYIVLWLAFLLIKSNKVGILFVVLFIVFCVLDNYNESLLFIQWRKIPHFIAFQFKCLNLIVYCYTQAVCTTDVMAILNFTCKPSCVCSCC